METVDFKSAINQVENSVINELMQVAQFALNDEDTITRVADEIGLPAARVEMLAGLAIEIANGEQPSIYSMQVLEAKTSELEKLKAEFE